MLSKGFEPDLFRLQEQYFEMMRKDYERIHITKKFPIKEFSEHVYLMKLGDKRELFKKDFQHELIMMEKYKMVIKRQIINSKEDNEEIWYFRHDKMMDYFVVHVFLSDEKLLSQHLDDPRMRGVYFMLADLLPYDTAMDLREILIQYAATTKDHTISDKFIQHLHARKHAI
jgi:hypothetical protein